MSALVTPAMENYLKAAYRLRGSVPVTSRHVADQVGVTSPSARKMVGRLGKLGLLRDSPGRGVELTAEGEAIALRVVRRHRLLELFLTERLGLSRECVHDEAEELEHYLSDELTERLSAVLGHPVLDPHGAPIPSRAPSR